MDLVSAWAATAAAIGGSATVMRARMLRPHERTWTHAPSPVWIGLNLVGLALLMVSVSTLYGSPANSREAMIYTLEACVSLVMLWNLNRHGRQAQVRREQFEAEARLAMDVGGPPIRVPWDRRR